MIRPRTLVLAALLLSAAGAAGSPQAPSGATGAPGANGTTGRDAGGPPPSRPPPRTPPPEAVAACSGRSVGASCTFQHQERTETGKCVTPDPAPAGACKPDRPPREEGPGNGR